MFSLISSTPSKDKFVKLVRAEMKRLGVPREWKYDEKEFTLTREKGMLYVGNAYASYCQAKGPRRDLILTNLVSAVRAQDSTITRERLGDSSCGDTERALLSFSSLLWETKDVQKALAVAV